MTAAEVLEAFGFVEKEDLQIWPEKCIQNLERENVEKILTYLENSEISGEELFVLDLPVFAYPAEKFKALWEALKAEHKRNFANDVMDEEIVPSDEFPRLEKKLKLCV